MLATTLLVRSLGASRRLLLDAVRDISATDLGRRPSPYLRSGAQILGSASVADREALRNLGVEILPPVPDGFEGRFARWGTGDDGGTHEHSSLPEIFSVHRLALEQAARSLLPDGFDERLEVEGCFDEDGAFRFETVGEMIAAASTYTHFLVGEVAVLRLSLGKKTARDVLDDLWDESGQA